MKNESAIVKVYEKIVDTSSNKKLFQIQKLLRNKKTQQHYYTYEVLDEERSPLGGRLIYEFKNPNQALECWQDFIGSGIRLEIDYSYHKE